MTRDEYVKRAAETGDWAPGWDAIDACLEKLYPGQEPRHYATTMIDRAIFGGSAYIDGYSVYQATGGYKHVVTYGMSELYANVEAFGGEFSRWGYEMTIKLPVATDDACLWALDMLGHYARYTYRQGAFFEPLQFIGNHGVPIKADSGTHLTAFMVVNDTELQGMDTIHGRLDFMQLVGITQAELEALMDDPANAARLVERMKLDGNSMLLTDLTRQKSYF